jgi:hypothetical protein
MPNLSFASAVLGSLLAGALSVFTVPRCYATVRAWLRDRAKARKIRPTNREALYARSLVLAEEIEMFGRENCDGEMELLGLVLTHSTYCVNPKHGFIQYRWGRLRDAADVVACYRMDKWWRPRKPRPTERVEEMLRRFRGDESDGAVS